MIADLKSEFRGSFDFLGLEIMNIQIDKLISKKSRTFQSLNRRDSYPIPISQTQKLIS